MLSDLTVLTMVTMFYRVILDALSAASRPPLGEDAKERGADVQAVPYSSSSPKGVPLQAFTPFTHASRRGPLAAKWKYKLASTLEHTAGLYSLLLGSMASAQTPWS